MTYETAQLAPARLEFENATMLAATLRLPAEPLRFLMLILLALTVVVSLQTVGVGLVAAMLVTPAATAYLVSRRLVTMMLVSAVIGAFSSVTGLYLSFYINVASGAVMVLVATLVFLLVFLLVPGRGWVWQRLGRGRPIDQPHAH